MVFDKIGDLGTFDKEMNKPVLEYDPFLDEYFLHPEAEKNPAYLYYLEYIGKSIFEDESNFHEHPEQILENYSTGIQKNDAFHELLFKMLADDHQHNRYIKINECNTRFSVRSCSMYPLEKKHTTKRRGNSCKDKLCPRCATKINIRETKKALAKFKCTGSTFISFEFTVPAELWLKIDHHKGIHRPDKIRCGKCGSETEILDQRFGKDHDIRKCTRRGCGWIGHVDQCIGNYFKLEDSGINKLCKAVNRTLKRFHGGQIGGFMAIHTFSSTSLSWKPHIHVLITDKVIINKDPVQIKRIKKWAEQPELDRLHLIYTEEINRAFGTDYHNVVCDRHYLKKDKLDHRLRYMNRLPTQFIYEDESGVYYNDKFKGMDKSITMRDEISGLNAIKDQIMDHIKRNGMYSRLMKYGDEGKQIINDYVEKVSDAMDSGAGKVMLYDKSKDRLVIENLPFFETMISHFWKRSTHNYRWIGWLSNSTWRHWVEKFKMPYYPDQLENDYCKCGAPLMSIGVMDENGWRWIIPELLEIMPDLITIHFASDHDKEYIEESI